MEQTEKRQHTIQTLFTITLFGIFALCCILVLIFGARIYQEIVSGEKSNAELRTSLSYVAEKIHQNDTFEGIRLDTIDEAPALLLSDSYNDIEYITYIYFWNGQLKEQTLRSDLTPSKNAGQTITELQDFQISQLNDRLYCFTACNDAGKEMSIYVNSKTR